MPQGALAMCPARVEKRPLARIRNAQRIRQLSVAVLEAEEGSLYPTLQRMLIEGWVRAEWGTSETNRRVRFYKLTREGEKQLRRELPVQASHSCHSNHSPHGMKGEVMRKMFRRIHYLASRVDWNVNSKPRWPPIVR